MYSLISLMEGVIFQGLGSSLIVHEMFIPKLDDSFIDEQFK